LGELVYVDLRAYISEALPSSELAQTGP